MAATVPAVDRRPATARYDTRSAGIVSRHSFSYGRHYDPANIGFGPLIAHNDEILKPGAGYDSHGHRGVDILTWVLTGALRHSDDLGNVRTLVGGQMQVLHAGRGVRHAERNAAAGVTRYLQMWLTADDTSEPWYQTPAPARRMSADGFVTVFTRHDARLDVARLPAGGAAELAYDELAHLFVATGRVTVAVADRHLLGAAPAGIGGPDPGWVLDDGDAVRLTGAATVVLHAVTEAEVFGWSLKSSPSGAATSSDFGETRQHHVR